MRLALAALLASSTASADPLRLRADALATTSAPAGLVTISADGDAGPNVSAEAVVWSGGGALGDDAHADVLVVALRARTADGRESVRLGRFVETLGALRPLQIDGLAARARLPYALDAEAYAGIPVQPDLTASRAWDWATGARLARRLGDMGSVGIAYAEQRDDGRLASEEVGVDAGASLGRADDVAAKLAYDLANPGIAEASLVASHRRRSLRFDLYASERAASHLLPATSLFSVLGDTPAVRAGMTLTWRAAPRLEVAADLGVRRAEQATSPTGLVRARLMLDALGKSALTAELRRDDGWTGARGAARIVLGGGVFASTELELVRPDHVAQLWPWVLGAVGWDSGTWQAAVALEALASPEYSHRLDVLAQLSRRWGVR